MCEFLSSRLRSTDNLERDQVPVSLIGRLLLVGALCILFLQPARVEGGSASSPKLLLHTQSAESGAAGSCQVGLTSCGGVNVQGGLYITGHYFVFLLAARFDTEVGLQEIHVGIDYDKTTGSGVDILIPSPGGFGWALCADSENQSPGWYVEGGDNRIMWSAEHCPRDSLAVAGYFYVAAYTSGYLALVPPAGGPATLTLCGGTPQPIETTELGYAGFGDVSGCNPCVTDCHYTAVEATTWSRIKAHFRHPRDVR
jgi:hypothetical protein